jgi:hypothetical protein
MKIPTYITAQLPVSLTHGFTSNFGTVNVSVTIALVRAKYLNGESVIDSIGTALPDFKSQIEDHTREVN